MKTIELQNKSDETLIAYYYKGKSNTVGILYNRHYSNVFNKCLSFSKNQDDAFDLTQDIFIKAFGKKNLFKGDSKFSTWLYSITFNHCVSSLKKQKNQRCESIDLHSTKLLGHEDYEEYDNRKAKEEKEIMLFKALSEIPEQDKKLLELKYQSKLSVNQIQLELKLSKSAVKMRLLRARQKVGKYYQEAI